MTLIVHAMGAYASYAHDEIKWRQDDYNVNKFVKALKGQQVNGFADLRDIDGSTKRINQESAGLAFELFGRWAAARLRQLDLCEATLVPVPSSSCTAFTDVTTPVKMARAVRRQLPESAVGRWLRFAEPMTQSHAGGTRNIDVLKDKLRRSPATLETRIVLVDDVKTTGAHLRACASVLRDAGATVETVIVAATTVWKQYPTPLRLDPEDLEAMPDFDWDAL